ncbi:MAG TPA: hypothetical protein PKK00_08740 [Bacteroidales bacterium]|nr:hypothetical protein [Bacteroidales bacterium]HPS17442.1 hypothetical protein [Bacteroidales bacterium]
METRLAKIISYLFHPVFVPIYGLLVLFNMKSYFSFELIFNAQLLILSFVFITTVIFPLFIIYFLKQQGYIQSFQMQSRDERRLPYLLMAIFYFITYQMFTQMHLPEIYSFYFMGATLLLALVVIINIWWKVSIHMVGMGGLFGMLTGLSIAFSFNTIYLLSIILLISGIVGFARLKLETHKPSEIYSGFLVGTVIMTCLYLFI